MSGFNQLISGCVTGFVALVGVSSGIKIEMAAALNVKLAALRVAQPLICGLCSTKEGSDPAGFFLRPAKVIDIPWRQVADVSNHCQPAPTRDHTNRYDNFLV